MKFKNKISIGKNILLANLIKKKTPISVYLSVTDACNLKCKYCNIPLKKKQKELTTEEIFRLIDDLHDLQAQRLELAGGEPMLRKDIKKIIDYAHKKRIFVTMSSNGYQISERIEELKNLGTLILSLDGNEKIHDFHKGKGSYKTIIKAIKAAKKHNINLLTTTVLTKKNKNMIDFILNTAKKYNFLANFQPLYFTGLNLKKHFHLKKVSNDLILSNHEYKTIFKKLIQRKKQKEPISSSLAYLKFLLNWQDYNNPYKNIKNEKMKCWAGKLHCYIDTDGTLYPCGDSIGRVTGPNIKERGFKKAFNLIAKNPCESCIIACDVEQNLMFSLNIRTIINWINKI